MELQSDVREERTMELQSEDVVHEPSRPRGKHRGLGRWLVMVVGALGLMAGFLLLDLIIRFWVFWPVGTALPVQKIRV